MLGAYPGPAGTSQYLGGVVANLASIPKDLTDPLQTLPIYTSLFNKLGIAAIVCTFIALAALPLMRKLTATHQSHQ
jgi:POT family proton-dependent oligopeptide transporter